MSKNRFLFFYFFTVVGFALNTAFADPNLLGYWTFNDGTASDSSIYGHHGTLIGSTAIIDDPEPHRSKVLSINSTSGSGVNCGGGDSDGDWADITESVTMSAWVKINTFEYDRQYIASKGNAFMMGRFGTSDHLRFYTTGFGSHDDEVEGTKDIQDNRWHFVVFVYDRFTGARYLYVDARIDASGSYKQYLGSNGYDFFIGGYEYYANRRWKGLIDDVRLYDRALSKREIRILYGSGFATEPSPADGAGNVSIGVNSLSWKPGEYAADVNGHDVYFGTDWYEVNEGNQAVHIGLQDGNSFDPGTLEGGTTYYWAIDAVNDGNVWPGYIWSFRTATEGFYKELFKDSGLKLNGTTEMPAVEYLGLSSEHLSLSYGGDIPPAEQIIQDAVFIGDGNDDNGVLLYPDGQPRFRCMYVDGGLSTSHGDSLGEVGRQRVRDFYHNGGCYSGSCAGAFITSTGVGGTYKPEYFHIWLARTLSQIGIFKVGYDLPINSPLLDYYDFGGDLYIENVQHWNGPYVISEDPTYWCDGTEVCTRFDASGKVSDGHVSIWAYKDDANSGRLVPIASHPERITSGEQRDLMAAVLQYAMDGQGSPKVKASLENGVTRNMYSNSIAAREKIGDRQYHHFTVHIPPGTQQLTITLNGDDAYDFNLFAKPGDFAFKGETGTIDANNTSTADEAIVINDPWAGTWYIGVKCVTTVSTTKRFWGWSYCGNTEVLNGLCYNITTEWDTIPGDVFADGRVDYNDLKVLSENWLDNNRRSREVGELIGWWELDEGDGNTAADSSGYDNTGTLYDGNGDVIEEPNWQGGALVFDANTYVQTAYNANKLQLSGDYTWATWIKADSNQAEWAAILDKYDPNTAGPGNNHWSLQFGVESIIDTSGKIVVWNGADFMDFWDTQIELSEIAGDWHHIAVVRSMTMMVSYLDGQMVACSIYTTNPISGAGLLNIGADRRLRNFFKGLIDDIQIYDYELCAAEINMLYEGLSLPSPVPEYICTEAQLGDLNNDCKVDSLDFQIVASFWLESNL